MDFLAFDIETIPNQLLPEDCKPQFDPAGVKPGNTKDPIKIKAKEDDARQAFEAGVVKTMSLDPALCSVCTYSESKFKDGAKFINAYQLTDEDEHDDIEAVALAISSLTEAYRQRMPIVSFNGLGFDLPVLFFRAIAQDIAIDAEMWRQINRRYANPHHYDLMQILSGWDRQRWHGQEFYANLFGLKDKDGFDGSMVFDAYQACEYERIKQYGMADAETLCDLFQRVEQWIKIEKKEDE